MTDIISLLPALFGGIVLGIIFFGGLWLTIRKGLRSKQAALVFTGSLILRLSITLLGFYFVGGSNWQRMLVCLAGFLAARIVIIQITKKSNHSKTKIIKEVSYEA
ncbi:MAG: ATP synthase subunit I [Ginsengibacter sp.]